MCAHRVGILSNLFGVRDASKRKRTSVEELDAANLGNHVLGEDLVLGSLDLDAAVRHAGQLCMDVGLVVVW